MTTDPAGVAIIAAALLSVVFVGCETAPKKTESVTPIVIKSESGKLLCGIHHMPLTAVDAWWSGGLTLVHPIGDAEGKYEHCNPNPFNRYDYSRSRTAKFNIPEKVTFCRWCDEGVGCDF